MVVDDYREIGCWFWYLGYFGTDTHFVCDQNNPESRVFMGKVLDITKVLKKHNLMLEVKGDNEMILRTDSLNNFMRDYYQYVSFRVSGKGLIMTTHQEEAVHDNLVSIFIDRLPLSFTIEVHSPVFLPITLDGYPQKALYDHNAPRLEKALQEIEECLGSKPDHEENEASEYAKMKGYRLVNFIEEDGIMFGLNERGHVLDERKLPKIPFDPEYLKSLT